MFILAYLLSAPLPASPNAGANDEPACIFFGSRTTDEGDEEHLTRFSEILLGLEKERTFNALHKHLPFTWNDKRYDTVNPFGDPRPLQYHALWTFDTQNDILRYTNADVFRQIPLALLRERGTGSLADMESLGGPVPALPEHTFDLEKRYWEPHAKVDSRTRAFAHRLLRDFNHQWRHILRNNYKFVTLRVLASAIIRLSTLDFNVQENTGGHGPRGVHVWITQLPAWNPVEGAIMHVGRACVVLCQVLHEGLSIVKQRVAARELSTTEASSTTDSVEKQPHYMILSVKYIMLCHGTDLASLKHTAPVLLFNGDQGVGPPSDIALDYLLWATTSARPLIVTPLQWLPMETQDMILKHVFVGTVVAAQVGCMLGLGSPFLWEDGPLKVTLEERHVIRPSGSSVESQVWFGGEKSG